MKSVAKIVRTKIWLVAAVLLLEGCYYDNEATLYPGSANCDTTVPSTFNNDVLPLLNAQCNSCHSGASPSAGIKLDTYPEVMKSVNNNSLMGSIQYASGFSPMPKNAGKMTSCQIQKIQNWVDAGAQNN